MGKTTRDFNDILNYIDRDGVLNLPPGLICWPGHIYIANNPKLVSLGNLCSTTQEGNVVIKNCPNFETMGDVVALDGHLRIENCPRFDSLGCLESVTEGLWISGNKQVPLVYDHIEIRERVFGLSTHWQRKRNETMYRIQYRH